MWGIMCLHLFRAVERNTVIIPYLFSAFLSFALSIGNFTLHDFVGSAALLVGLCHLPVICFGGKSRDYQDDP